MPAHSEQDLQRQLALTKNQLRDLRMSHESNQAKLLDHTQRQGEESFVRRLPMYELTDVVQTKKLSPSSLNWT